MYNSVRQSSHLVLNSFQNPQPVQTDESISYVVAGLQAVDQSGRRIQNRLESPMGKKGWEWKGMEMEGKGWGKGRERTERGWTKK